jgi:hypothetical protein
MGHKTIEITFKIYRRLMPGSISKAAKVSTTPSPHKRS